jgi:hypothetical protein
MTDKKTFKSFREFAKDYLKEYDDANFAGVGGFSIGSMDAMKPEVDLGDTAPRNQGTGDSRGTMAVMPSKNIQHDINRKDHKKKDNKGKTMTGHSLTKVNTDPKMSDTQDIKDVIDHVIPHLQFVNENVAREGVTRIENSNQSIVHKIQAATNMAERARVASERSSDLIIKQQLNAAYNVYKGYIDKNK